ncbi:MAG: TRAP transporter substrate-binding protein DctP [Lachnospiraceae bacterium]|nr:TRAP transporter substrate-binding protein DctP [Lachnospiraceae bacterium]
MKKKTLGLVLAAVLTAGSLFGCGGDGGSKGTTGTEGGSGQAASGDKIELRMAQASAADGAIGQSMEEFAKLVNEKSGGRIEITVFHNGQLGTERDNVEACQLGNLDIAVVNNSVLANFIPWFSAFDLPYVIENTDHADKVFLGEIGDDMLKAMDDVGIKGLSVWESGFRNLTNSVREVNSLADVSGLRIRVMENAVHQALWGALGADAVPMNWSDAYTAMQQGAIDGQENPTTVIDKNNVVEVNKNLAVTEHVYSTVSIIMAPSVWNSLSADDQKILTDAMAEIEVSERELSRTMDTEAVSTLESQGMKVTRPDKDEFIEATKTVRDEYGKDYADVLDRVAAAK